MHTHTYTHTRARARTHTQRLSLCGLTYPQTHTSAHGRAHAGTEKLPCTCGCEHVCVHHHKVQNTAQSCGLMSCFHYAAYLQGHCPTKQHANHERYLREYLHFLAPATIMYSQVPLHHSACVRVCAYVCVCVHVCVCVCVCVSSQILVSADGVIPRDRNCSVRRYAHCTLHTPAYHCAMVHLCLPQDPTTVPSVCSNHACMSGR